MAYYNMISNPQAKKPKISKREVAFARKAAEAVFSKKGSKHHDD